ncbi:MAG: response regulator [Proteobacteria bacterium]|nr:response regulator [Pseudomonadota bacterium]
MDLARPGSLQFAPVRGFLAPMPLRANTVVIIDDEPAAADALATIVRDWGADVTVGADAESIAGQLGPRIGEVGWIIADFHLGPGVDGVRLAREIAEAAPAARVLVLSGSFRGQASAEAARAGYEIMLKPVRAEKIVSWLERA